MRQKSCFLSLAGFSLAMQMAVPAMDSHAQSSIRNPDGPMLRTQTSLVLVDVVVTEKDKPVTGLTKDRFHIFEDRREQHINFKEDHFPPPSGVAHSPRVLPSHIFTNIPDTPAGVAVNVLLLDGLNTSGADQMEVRRQMLAYMSKLDSGTSLAVFTLTSRLRMVQGFTSDVAELTRAVQKSPMLAQTSSATDLSAEEVPNVQINNIPVTVQSTARAEAMKQFQADTHSFQTDMRVQITLEAFRELARYLSAIPGRKNLIWFSGSFPLQIQPELNASLKNKFAGTRDYGEKIRETSSLLATSRVAVYPVDARGLMGLPVADASRDTNPDIAKTLAQTYAEQDSMLQIAQSTGGKAYLNSNGLKEAVADAIAAGSSYYTLGYAPSNKNFHGEFRHLKVRVDGTSAKLGYRTGYYADSPDKPDSHSGQQTDLLAASALRGAPPSTQILFKAYVLPANDILFKNAEQYKGSTGELTTKLKPPLRRERIEFTIDPRGLSFEKQADGRRSATVEFAVLAYDEEGKRVNYIDKAFQIAFTRQRYAEITTSGWTSQMFIDVPKVPIVLRLVVHDMTSQRTGSVEVPLAIE